jgi:hypothetical protein
MSRTNFISLLFALPVLFIGSNTISNRNKNEVLSAISDEKKILRDMEVEIGKLNETLTSIETSSLVISESIKALEKAKNNLKISEGLIKEKFSK